MRTLLLAKTTAIASLYRCLETLPPADLESIRASSENWPRRRFKSALLIASITLSSTFLIAASSGYGSRGPGASDAVAGDPAGLASGARPIGALGATAT